MIVFKRIVVTLAVLLLPWGGALFCHYSQTQNEQASEISGFPAIDSSILLEEARQGKPYSQWAYAELIEMNLVPNMTPQQAYEWYQRAASAGFRPAQVSLKLVKSTVGDFNINTDSDARMLHLRAVGGDPKACSKLDEWYLEREEFDQSSYWLAQSVSRKLSHDPFKNYIAAATLFRRGGKNEQRKAIEIMRIVAGPLPGYYGYELAEMLESAQGDLRNPWEAERWYRKAAEAGNPQAQVRMGIMYYEGDLIGLKSEYEAVRWFKKAVEARKNREGFSFIPDDPRLAVLYYLSMGVDGLSGSRQATVSTTKLEYLMNKHYDLQKAFYATALGIRNTETAFVQKEVKRAAHAGKEYCDKKDDECQAMAVWFQLLAGESADIIANRDMFIKINSAISLFHLAHAYLIHGNIDEATILYNQGLAKASRHETYRLDEELELLSWHFASKHSLFAAARMTINADTKLTKEEDILRYEDIKGLKAQMIRDKMIKEQKP
ncbi:sel1 repeat family protein [Trichlorobacter lovleyi]|uniref:tetratricopeptide repeat protein n=1 Tax=Trichlorobacter lovleyi TaxID=313985 RepID=UPI00223EE038|nr:tetratricopeptide repeat protein [Trichlorobacter lovleyi]QOX79859.1 sel1 repeat family protein [Trichlorobacter lovleyi]